MTGKLLMVEIVYFSPDFKVIIETCGKEIFQPEL